MMKCQSYLRSICCCSATPIEFLSEGFVFTFTFYPHNFSFFFSLSLVIFFSSDIFFSFWSMLFTQNFQLFFLSLSLFRSPHIQIADRKSKIQWSTNPLQSFFFFFSQIECKIYSQNQWLLCIQFSSALHLNIRCRNIESKRPSRFETNLFRFENARHSIHVIGETKRYH